MKNNFQSKAVPRGTRTIWRYLSALFILFTFAIGNVWADTEIFSWTVSSALAKNTSEDATGGTTACTGANMGSKFTPTGGPDYYKFGTSTTLTFTLSSGKYAAGDVISVTFTNTSSGTKNVGAIIQETTPKTELITGVAKGDPEVQTYTVLASDGIAGENKFSVMRGGSDASNFAIRSVTVTRPAPSCSTEITTQPSGATLAIGDANPELSIVATNVASYAWKESSNGTSYDGTSSLGSSASFTPSVNDAVQTKYYYCEVTSSCDGAAVSKSNIVTVNVVGAISYYTVTLNPAGGTIVDATGWTLNAGNYEKEVAEGTVLTLPTFTKTNRTFKTWRKAGPTDVASPITVSEDVTLTAVWNATVEQVIYSWEGAEGGATETGGTATGSVDGLINVAKSGYYCLQINGNTSYDKYVQITLSGEEKVKTGDKIRYTGFYTNTETKNAAVKMRASGGTAIFTGANLPRIEVATPRTDTYVVPEGINTASVQITRHQTQTSSFLTKLQIIRPTLVEEANLRTVTFNYNDGGATANKVVEVVSGATVSAEAVPSYAHHRFHEWQLGGVAYDFATVVTSNITLVADWTQLYTVTYAAGDGTATGDAPTQEDKAEGETFTVAANSFEVAGKVFDHWNDGTADYDPEDTYTVGTSNVTLTAIWRTPSTMYAITKGDHDHGDFTIDPASQEAGEVVTLEATPDADYLFSAWEVVKTEDGTDAGVTVTNGEFTMPAFAVTVNATFVADPRKKVLYVTSTAEATVKENDKLYDALKDIYNVSIVGPTSEADQTNYDLVVLHESIGGSSYNAAAVAAAKTGSTPVLNTKSYFYNDDRFGWGTPNAGQSVKGATLNSAYCNIASHPLFDGLTITDGFFEITDEAAAKCMQPVGSFTSGKEGYTLATTPNSGEGNGCAIHELTPAQRGASAGKYLMISVFNDKLNALNANGQKLFQNAAAYLIGSSEWSPVLVPTTPEITGTTAYSAGETIELTASATGESAATTYTWYKGATLEAAKEAGAIQAAKTIAENGNVYSKAECVVGDAGTYWCVISNGTDCEANASVEITVSDASYNASFVSAHGTAPVATSGVSYTLPELTESGYVHQGWTANIDVTVDEAVVTAGTTIANGKTAIFGADVTFTAVWKQIFAVTFNLNGQSGSIAPQDIIDGEKATKPADPVVIGQEFGGWFTDAACTEGNEFDFNTAITEAKELFAKWTAFDGCALLYPALSGDALHVGDNVDLISGSTGVSIAIVGMKNETSITYNANGLSLSGGGADVISVTLNNDMTVGTKISVTLMAANTGSRGLNLLNATGGSVAGGTKLGWDDATLGEVGTFSYTVEASDGLEGTNIFRLQRNNSVYLQCVKVESCGAAITYHNLTSEVNIAGKGTVTLGASSVREGYTTTATYSEIDPLYEFVNWTVSGAGASVADATANPATITIGTEDAVVTLNLQLIPVKFTVNYYDGATAMGTELVPVNEHPTASEIKTAKRHYTFLGWSLTDGGDIVALNTITRTEATTVDLFAKYEQVACPVSGTIFSMEFDETKKPGETVKVAKNGGSIDMAEYATISGGNAMIINNETDNKDAISEDGEFLLKATKEVMKIELNCVLQEGDIIRIPDNSAKLVISTSNAKTGTYQAFADKNTHEFAVTAAWAGVDVIYVLYDGSSLKFTKVYVIRPAKYTVSFDMKGHGSAIADIENVLEGSKITAPTAPTDENFSFSAWYKETTLENVWNFAEDVVTANTTLFAKWIDKSDATLKSLKYGSFDIALENDVYEYNIGLPSATVAVPALTAETNNPLATAAISDATEFDGEGKATSTVVVTPEKEGAAHKTYTVKFTKLAALPQVNVTGSTTWNFSAGGSTSLTNQSDVVLANLPGINNDENFNSQALLGSFNKMEGTYFQGSKLSFTTEVPGKLTITFRGTNGNTRHLQACVGDGETVVADWVYNSSSTSQTKTIFVPEGKVTLKAFEGETPNNARIYQMIFNATPDYTRPVTEGRYGTICLPNGGVMTGATIFEIAYMDYKDNKPYKIYFDEVLNGTMVAGMPYIFLPNESATQLGVFYTDAADAEEGHHNGLYGKYTKTLLVKDAGNYILKNNQYWYVNSDNVYCDANRAYIVLADVPDYDPGQPAYGRRRVALNVNSENQAQGFENIETGDAPMKIMIEGQMYILRGERVYDATGRLVK